MPALTYLGLDDIRESTVKQTKVGFQPFFFLPINDVRLEVNISESGQYVRMYLQLSFWLVNK